LDVLNGFDDRFFLFLEDTDLCRRTWDAGYRVLQVPTVNAFHEQKRLSGEGLFASMRKKTFWIHVLSVLKYFWKWKGVKKPKVF
jgi:GT2 family glycosyltransferase